MLPNSSPEPHRRDSHEVMEVASHEVMEVASREVMEVASREVMDVASREVMEVASHGDSLRFTYMGCSFRQSSFTQVCRPNIMWE